MEQIEMLAISFRVSHINETNLSFRFFHQDHFRCEIIYVHVIAAVRR